MSEPGNKLKTDLEECKERIAEGVKLYQPFCDWVSKQRLEGFVPQFNMKPDTFQQDRFVAEIGLLVDPFKRRYA